MTRVSPHAQRYRKARGENQSDRHRRWLARPFRPSDLSDPIALLSLCAWLDQKPAGPPWHDRRCPEGSPHQRRHGPLQWLPVSRQPQVSPSKNLAFQTTPSFWQSRSGASFCVKCGCRKVHVLPIWPPTGQGGRLLPEHETPDERERP